MITRRRRSAISAARSAASASSPCPAPDPVAGPAGVAAGSGTPSVRGAAAASPPGSAASPATTLTVPWSMFIPQANPNSPVCWGVKSTVVLAYAGSASLIRKSGRTTLEEQSPLSCRSKTRRTGTPWTTSTRSGL